MTPLLNDAVARNDERYGIRTHRLTHSSGSAAVSDCRRDVLVSREAAEWNLQERFPDLDLEVRSAHVVS
jgi:hypothetical protein